jgi:hypothetical protein
MIIIIILSIGSLGIPPWNDPGHVSNVMKEKGYRVLSNEWDAFTEDMFTWPGAVLATTFRYRHTLFFYYYLFF